MRYTSSDEDSARWDDFPFRSGDIVISTRSKSGTTWMQMICALLVFQTPELPASLTELSPWLDWLITPREEVIARLEAQQHRRFIKTHTPLDGLPLDPHATYLVVARHPLDMAVSLFHQSANLNRERIAELTGAASPPAAPAPAKPRSMHDSLIAWIDRDVTPADALDSLPGVLWHLRDAWERRHADNVLLVHYADLSTDLEGSMRAVAGRLGIAVPEHRWPELVAAAGFDHMRAKAKDLAPDPAGIMKDTNAFFRRGTSGSGRELLAPEEYARYLDRAARLAPPDFLAWLNR
ncbi:MAG TPA: sulfotransferase domain-containing protein [Actinoplanes sp.]|nr:sulfotransferase domain-containing protein [Actinoplanes sp.]